MLPKIMIDAVGARPSKVQMLMMMAYSASSRSVCARRRAVGTIIVTPDLTNVLSIGYNGPARGINEPCTTTPNAAGSCTCVHAEANALIKTDYRRAGMITTLAPCAACARLILNSGVSDVWYHEAYRDDAGVKILQDGGINVYPVELWTEIIL